jgi:methionine synthase I (cobalamin-dependent)
MTDPITDAVSRLLAERSSLVADGAMGTNLMAMGLDSGDAPELWNVAAPARVAQLHDEFIAAGVDILLTNSFGANAARLGAVGAEHRVQELNLAAAELARTATRRTDRTVVVAGVIGPTGERLEPGRAVDRAADRARRVFTEQAEALAAGGVDVLWLETFSALAELGAALDGADSTALPLVATMTFGATGSTLAGESPAAVLEFLEARDRQLVAFGANCGSGPASVIEALRALRDARDTGGASPPLVAKANCGLPERLDAGLVYPISPGVMGRYARVARDAGARIIGGCCGSTPAHIREIVVALERYAPRELSTPRRVAEEFATPPSDHRPGGQATDSCR